MADLWIGTACMGVGGWIVFVRFFLPPPAFWSLTTLVGAMLFAGGFMLIRRADLEADGGSDSEG
jgi:hypothetical protein